jgi:multiple sugar transport system permease protein
MNSAIVAIGSTALTITTGSCAAFGLTRMIGPSAMGVRMRHSILGAMIATRILPPVIVVLPILYLVQAVDLDDTRIGLIIAYASANLPVAIRLLRGFLMDMPRDAEEAAQLDGASNWRILLTITAPMLAGGLAATSVLVFLMCWNEYLVSVYLTAYHAMTMPPFLASQMTTREQMAASEPDDYARLAVVAVLMIAPLILSLGIFSRLLARLAGSRS